MFLTSPPPLRFLFASELWNSSSLSLDPQQWHGWSLGSASVTPSLYECGRVGWSDGLVINTHWERRRAAGNSSSCPTFKKGRLWRKRMLRVVSHLHKTIINQSIGNAFRLQRCWCSADSFPVWVPCKQRPRKISTLVCGLNDLSVRIFSGSADLQWLPARTS